MRDDIKMRYCVLKTSWGISIELLAELVDYEKCDFKDKTEKVSEGIWITSAERTLAERDVFDLEDMFTPKDLIYLKKGLKLIMSKFKSNSIYKENLIIIKAVRYNLCDFQEEGLTAAIVEWASETLNFQKLEINVEYDKETNRYVYDFENFE